MPKQSRQANAVTITTDVTTTVAGDTDLSIPFISSECIYPVKFLFVALKGSPAHFEGGLCRRNQINRDDTAKLIAVVRDPAIKNMSRGKEPCSGISLSLSTLQTYPRVTAGTSVLHIHTKRTVFAPNPLRCSLWSHRHCRPHGARG